MMIANRMIRPPQPVRAVSDEDGQVMQFSSLAKASEHFKIHHGVLSRRLGNGQAWNGWKFELVSTSGRAVAATEPVTTTTDPLASMFGQEFAQAFQGKQLRVTSETPRRISVYDLIGVVADVEQPRKTWLDMCAAYPEVVTLSNNLKFPGAGQRDTPVVDLQGMITIINLLKGEHAARVRAGQAKLLVRYLGGDESLVDEVRGIAEYHREGRGEGTLAGLAHEQTKANALTSAETATLETYRAAHKFEIMSPRQIGINLTFFSNKSVCYLLVLCVDGETLLKFGHTTDVLTRISDHQREIPELMGIWFVCEAPKEVETAFKEHMRYAGKLVSMRLGNKNQTELLRGVTPECAEVELAKIVQNTSLRSDVEVKRLELEIEKARILAEVEREKLMVERARLKAQLITDAMTSLHGHPDFAQLLATISAAL
jgi:hypothetical protein